jgi:hypothetical protein
MYACTLPPCGSAKFRKRDGGARGDCGEPAAGARSTRCAASRTWLVVSLTTVNLLVVYFDQFGAVVDAVLQCVLFVGVVQYERRYVALRERRPTFRQGRIAVAMDEQTSVVDVATLRVAVRMLGMSAPRRRRTGPKTHEWLPYSILSGERDAHDGRTPATDDSMDTG